MERITNKKQVKNYLLAGNSAFNLISHTTGVRILFRVVKSKNPKYSNRYSVYKFGTEIRNLNDDYKGHSQFIGVLYENDKYIRLVFCPDKKANPEVVGRATKAFQFFISKIAGDLDLDYVTNLPSKLEFLPTNTCCKCGKLLTTPESIRDGIGPQCKNSLISKGRW